MFASGGSFCCLLISVPLLPPPAGRHGDAGAPTGPPSSTTRKAEGTTGRGPQGPSDFPECPLPFLTAAEAQQRVERWWRQGPQGAEAERRVHAEIMRFKGTYVVVSRMRTVVFRVPKLLGGP